VALTRRLIPEQRESFPWTMRSSALWGQ